MRGKVVKESLNESIFRNSNKDGLGTALINFTIAAAGAGIALGTGSIWGLVALITGSVGFTFGTAGEMSYASIIDDLDNIIKGRLKKSTALEEAGNEIQNVLINNPDISPGKKAVMTKAFNKLKNDIESKNWMGVTYTLNNIKELNIKYNQ